jgi:internalin A
VLLGLLVLAVAGRADEAAAVKAVEKLGGRVIVDTKRPGKPVVGVDLDRTKVTDAALKELKELKSLRKLDLTNTKVTDAALKELKELKSLEVLFLTGTKVTDAGVKELQAARPGLKIFR